MRTKTEKTGSFTAVDDAGQKHTVNEWTVFHDASTVVSTSVEWEAVSVALKLTNGDHVNALADGTMQVVRTGIRLRRV